jgi:hypothetical protein
MQFDFNLQANGGQVIDVAGRFFKYKSGTGLIRVKTDKGGYVDLLPGQGVWGVEFSSLNVQDKSGAANAGVILAGGFDFRDDRISGSVEVIDGGRDRTLANRAFWGQAGVGVVAAQYPHVQLFNPAASGVNVYIPSIVVSSGTAGFVGIGVQFAALDFVNFGTSKKVGGSAAKSEVQRRNINIKTWGAQFTSRQVQANVSVEKKLAEPILLTPGWGAVVWHETVATDLSAEFEFIEIPVGS